VAQCIGKRRFESEDDAARALDTIRSNPESWERAKVPSAYYHCDMCMDWHLTAMPQNVRRARHG
jgi:hypothetical protein